MSPPIPLPLSLRELSDDLDARLEQVSAGLNEYGYDPFGMSPVRSRPVYLLGTLLYRYYFRVEVSGIENVPNGRALLVANHAGNTIPFDGGLLSLALLLESEPPRIARGMAEFYLPRIPWWNELIHRVGAVVGTPENCQRLLATEQVIMAFPEGHRGFIKPYSKAYQLQRFGTGFIRLALEAKAPIVPVGIVGSEEQSPGLWDSKFLGRLVGAPAFPITVTFPLLGPLGFGALPVKYRILFGEPLQLEGNTDSDDEAIMRDVDRVRDRISLLLEEGLAQRRHWFA